MRVEVDLPRVGGSRCEWRDPYPECAAVGEYAEIPTQSGRQCVRVERYLPEWAALGEGGEIPTQNGRQ